MFDTTDSEVYTLKLFDIGGQEVFHECSDSVEHGFSQNLNLAGFHKGIYILEIQGTSFNEYISLIIH